MSSHKITLTHSDVFWQNEVAVGVPAFSAWCSRSSSILIDVKLLSGELIKICFGRMKYLLEIGLSERDVAFMVRRFSPLLGYDIDTVLRPKVEFLVNIMEKPLKNVVEYPRYFSYSLKKKIKPRYWLLKRRKVECSLKDMLGKNNEEFASEFLDVERMLASPYLEKVAEMLCENDGAC